MFDLGMSELLVIGIVALIVIGPKELPGLFRSVGKFTGKMRAMAREFSRAMEAAADEAGVKDVARDLKEATSAKSMGLDKVREAADKFQKWDPVKNAARPTTPAAPAANPTLAAAPKPPEPAAEAAPAPAPVSAPEGSETAALAAKVAERKAIASEAAEKLRATRAPAAPPAAPTTAAAPAEAAPAVKRAGRTRSAAKAKTTDEPA